MAATIRDVARLAGVSPATVSRYYAGNGVVTDASGKRIEKAAASLGYVPAPRKRVQGNIAIIMTGLKLDYYKDALHALLEESRRYDYRIPVIHVQEGREDYKQALKDLNVTGVIYVEEDLPPELLHYIHAKHIRAAVFGGAITEVPCKMVHINNLAAARKGVQYLFGIGHKKILILSDVPKSIQSGFQRISGCRRAYEEAGLEFNERLLRCAPPTFDNGYQLMRQVLSKKLDFSAVFAFSDDMALGAILALHDSGLKVPDDVSVLGFDGSTMSGRVTPRLTTIGHPFELMAKIVLDTFRNQEIEGPIEVIVPYQFIRGETCRAIT